MKNNLVKVSINENFGKAVETAERIFFDNGIFIYPTDTIYGFGGNPFTGASEKISRIKGRDESKKFILLVPDVEILNKYIETRTDKQIKFLNRIWPNPISIVLTLNDDAKKKLNSDTAAFRIPNHMFCKQVLERIKMPLISTSVNRAGEPPVNSVDKLVSDFAGGVDAIFYEEKTSSSAASTLIDLTGYQPALIREGTIKFQEIIGIFEDISR